MLALRNSLQGAFPRQRFLVVFGASNDKNIKKMLRIIAPLSSGFIATRAGARGASTKRIASALKALGKPCMEIPSVKGALGAAVKAANENNALLVCGSCFVAGEAKQALKQGHFF
jgi:dihydrofolate synthase/folylpolyglutamate synthase